MDDDYSIEERIYQAKRLALSTGLILADNPENGIRSASFLPFCLYPSTINRAIYERATAIEPIIARMFMRIASDHSFLNEVLGKSSANDPYIDRLLRIMNEVDALGVRPRGRVEITRNDYMIDSATGLLKQVEFNLVSAAYVVLTDHIQKLHRHFARKHNEILNCGDEAGKALCDAVDLYDSTNNKTVVIFVIIGPQEANISDHMNLAAKLNRPVHFLSLSEIARSCSLDQKHRLFLEKNGCCFEVAVVYFRAGYSIDHMKSEDEWSALKMIESSVCVKSTGVDRRLANTKRIQAELARNPKLLEKYAECDDQDVLDWIRSTFCETYRLEFENELFEAKERVAREPGQWVLKSNTEGGGNKRFGSEADDVVIGRAKSNDQQLNTFILQKLINPRIYKNIIVRAGAESKEIDVVDEIGIFSAILIRVNQEKDDGDEIIYNKVIGNLVRTKQSKMNEVGILAGFGAIGSLTLSE